MKERILGSIGEILFLLLIACAEPGVMLLSLANHRLARFWSF